MSISIRSIQTSSNRERVSDECLNLLGNLALVSVGANSKFSNSLPNAKADNFQTTIEIQSPKLQEMSRITRNEQEWGDKEVRAHHEAMIKCLRSDLGLSQRPTTRNRAWPRT